MHFAKKIGCIALLIQYLQVTCAWHIYNTKESRRELATNWRKNEKSFTSRKTVNRSVKWLKKTQTSVEDARQKHVQILEKVYGAQRLVSETSSRASVSTITTTVVSAISTTTISTSTNLKKSLNRKRICVQSKLNELFSPVAKKIILNTLMELIFAGTISCGLGQNPRKPQNTLKELNCWFSGSSAKFSSGKIFHFRQP